VKINSALKNRYTNLQIRKTTYHIARAITVTDETVVCVQSEVQCLCNAAYHRRMLNILGQHHIKTVMIADVLPLTRKDLEGTSFKPQ
jgi:citrate lyase synthetase